MQSTLHRDSLSRVIQNSVTHCCDCQAVFCSLVVEAASDSGSGGVTSPSLSSHFWTATTGETRRRLRCSAGNELDHATEADRMTWILSL